MTTKKIYDTRATEVIYGTNGMDWITNIWGADTIHGRRGDDMVQSTSRDDFVFYGGQGNDHAEISLVPEHWDVIETVDGNHTTLEFFKLSNDGVPKVMQTVELYDVESYHTHHDNPILFW